MTLMTLRTTTLSLALLAGAGMSTTTMIGCEHGDAAAQAAAQEQLIALQGDLRDASAGGLTANPDERDQAQRELQRVISDLRGLNADMSSEQQAAASMIAATAHAELAAMLTADIDRMETAQMQARRGLLGQVSAIARLTGRAEALHRVDTESAAARLAQNRQRSEATLASLTSSIEALETPMAESREVIDQNIDSATTLEDRANTLRREANELGHLYGFPKFAEAIQLEREADRHDLQRADAEAELTIDLQPRFDLLSMKARHERGQIAATEASSQELQEFVSVAADHADAARTHISGLRDEVASTTQSLQSERDGALAEKYDAALQHWEQAASSAQRAARGASAGSARLHVAKAEIQRGELLLRRARAMESHAALAAATRAVVGGDIQISAPAPEAARTDREKATEAFTTARQSLDQVRGNDEQLTMLKDNLDAAIAAAGVMEPASAAAPAPMSSAAQAPSGEAAGAEVGAGAGPDGFATADGLFNHLKALGSDPQRMAEVYDYQHAPDMRSKTLVKRAKALTEATINAITAIEDQFPEAGDLMAATPLGMQAQMMSTAQKTTETADRVVYSLGTPGQDITLIRVDDQWLVEPDPSEQAIIVEIHTLTPKFNAFAEDVRTGEYDSLQAASAGLNELFGEVMQAAMSANANAPGGAPQK